MMKFFQTILVHLIPNFYLGKDNVTKWKKTRPNLQVRIRSHNIIKLLPGTKGNARNVETEIECLNLFVNDSVIRIITVSTNLYIQKVRVNFQEDRMNQDARETDDIEIRAFIGILFLIGALRSSRKNLHKIWDNSQGNGVESCYLAMSEKRFRFLIRCLRFDDINTRQQRRAIDKLAPIRKLFAVSWSTFKVILLVVSFLLWMNNYWHLEDVARLSNTFVVSRPSLALKLWRWWMQKRLTLLIWKLMWELSRTDHTNLAIVRKR